ERDELRGLRTARLVPGHDVRRGLVQRLVQILLAGLPRLALAAALADGTRALLVREQVRGAGAEAVARGAAADAVEHLLPRGHELLGRRVGPEGQLLRHVGLHLRDLVADHRIQDQRPEDDPDDLEVSGPHAGPLSPRTRRWTSPRARPARRRTRRGRGRSART